MLQCIRDPDFPFPALLHSARAKSSRLTNVWHKAEMPDGYKVFTLEATLEICGMKMLVRISIDHIISISQTSPPLYNASRGKLYLKKWTVQIFKLRILDLARPCHITKFRV
jgi:hypothetical protein